MTSAMFGKEVDLRKWIKTVVDLIDVKKKGKNVLNKK
jgi:hypothetical protein